MKKILLIISLFFITNLAFAAGGPPPGIPVAFAAGGPIPGVNVSLEQIPGGVIATESVCLKKGGNIVHNNGKTYCKQQALKRGRAKLSVSDEGRHKRIIATTETEQNGTSKFSMGTISSKSVCLKKGGNVIHRNGKTYCEMKAIIMKRILRDESTAKRSSMGTGNTDNAGDFTLESGSGPVDNNGDFTLSTPAISGGSISITIKHSPRRFSTGGRGTFKIVVKNKGNKLEKGVLTLIGHVPSGLLMNTGDFRAGSWHCKGGMVSRNGQNVTCIYNRKLAKKSRATLELNAKIAPAGSFPANVKEVESCAIAFIKDSSEQSKRQMKSEISRNSHQPLNRTMSERVCENIKIRHAKSFSSFNLPISIGIGLGGLGGGTTQSKQPGVAR